MCVLKHTRTHTLQHTNAYAFKHKRTRVHWCARAHAHTHTHIHKHTHIHMLTFTWTLTLIYISFLYTHIVKFTNTHVTYTLKYITRYTYISNSVKLAHACIYITLTYVHAHCRINILCTNRVFYLECQNCECLCRKRHISTRFYVSATRVHMPMPAPIHARVRACMYTPKHIHVHIHTFTYTHA